MFVSKKRHDGVVEAYEKRIAALELEAKEEHERARETALDLLREKRLRVQAEDALATGLAATKVALANADARAAAADASLARYLEDFAPRALEPVS